MQQTEETLQLVKDTLDELKARQITILDVRHLTSVTDYMLIASGTSSRQINALACHLVKRLKHLGVQLIGVEGEKQGEWALVDLGNIIVHIMDAQTRDYYQLERLWGFGTTQKLDRS